MFKLSDATETYDWTVTVKIPHNGSYKKYPIKVQFNRLPHEERVAMKEKIQATYDTDDATQVENSFFDQVLAGWHKGQVKDDNGEDLEFNEDSKRQLLSISEFRQAVIDGYFDSVVGDKAKQKNLYR